MNIAVLALQGAFVEHRQMLRGLGAETFEIRQPDDWNKPKDALIIPGGESTVMLKLLHELGLFQPIRQAIVEGLPVFGTCAGLILLSQQLENARSPYTRFATMNITTCRNAYGRQLGSFFAKAPFKGIDHDVPMTFIRAPYIEQASEQVEILAEIGGHIVAARQDNQLVTAFHPELNNDASIHSYFIEMIKNNLK